MVRFVDLVVDFDFFGSVFVAYYYADVSAVL